MLNVFVAPVWSARRSEKTRKNEPSQKVTSKLYFDAKQTLSKFSVECDSSFKWSWFCAYVSISPCHVQFFMRVTDVAVVFPSARVMIYFSCIQLLISSKFIVEQLFAWRSYYYDLVPSMLMVLLPFELYYYHAVKLERPSPAYKKYYYAITAVQNSTHSFTNFGGNLKSAK